VNKRKRVADHKHRVAAKKLAEKRKAGRAGAAPTSATKR
jgi:hypothetical protein